MDQNKIIEALQKALANGTGSLDDLDQLLSKARADIEQAKKDEAAAAEKAKREKGDKVAELATRILNDNMTAEDMAFVMNTWFVQNGLRDMWTAENINDLMCDCNKKTDECVKEAKEAINDLSKFLNDIFGIHVDPSDINIKIESDLKPKKKAAPQLNTKPKTDPDDVINDFLKKFGLA